MKSKIISVRICRLITDTRSQLDLHDAFYIPSVSKNLVSLSKFDLEDFSFTFVNFSFKLIKYFILVGTEILCNGLCKMNLDSSFAQSLFVWNINVGMKCGIINESCSILWYRWLGHISKKKMTRLVKKSILSNLDFSDFDMCIDCIKKNKLKIIKYPLEVKDS